VLGRLTLGKNDFEAIEPSRTGSFNREALGFGKA
jgi:hypothetical protein